MVLPMDKNRPENISDVVPSAAPALTVGVIPVVMVGEVKTQDETETESSNVGLAAVDERHILDHSPEMGSLRTAGGREHGVSAAGSGKGARGAAHRICLDPRRRLHAGRT